MLRQSQLRLAATAVVLFAFLAIGRSSPLPAAGAAQSAAAVGGAANLLSTTHGVVWSFNIENGSGVVLRSADDGNHWRVVLSQPASQVSFGLVASYFLGPEDAWAVSEEQTGATSVYRTSDGGRHWYLSDLPIVAPPPNMPLLSDQLYFADPEHGWLLAVGTNFSPPTNSLTMVWWRTDNGGRTWSQLPPTSLPPQAVALPLYADTACPEFSSPHIAFASADVGWWTYGACGEGAARPLVWSTRDGGLNWIPSPLPAPSGGWGRWDVLDQGGTDVGTPYLIPSRAGTTIIVPVSVGTSRLVIELSLDMGRTWHIASVVDTHALPIQSTPADWFDPVNAFDWVVAAPGGLIATTNAGETWTLTRSPVALSGQPVSFTSPDTGFVQGAGLVIALRTSDRGVTWNPESAPISRSVQASWSLGYVVSAVQIVGPHLAVTAGATGLMTSSDGGRSWVDRLGITSPVGEIDFINTQVGFTVDNGELLRTIDGGARWHGLLHPVAGGVSGIDFWSPSHGLVAVGQSLFVTSDAGVTWQPLRLPPGWKVPGAFVGGDEPVPVCFTDRGIGWAAATRDHRYGVLVSTTGGRSWRLALPSDVLPPGAEPDKLGGNVSIAGCDGKAAWILVSQAAGPMEMQGVPITFDLLRSLDLGRSWLDVLRSTSEARVARPKVPTSPGGPQSVPLELGEWALALVSPATAWFTATNEDLGSITLGSTRDGGLHWDIRSSPGAQDQQGPVASSRQLPYAYRWLATAALNAENAWVLFSAPEGSSEGYLYATSDGGAAWHRLAVFR